MSGLIEYNSLSTLVAATATQPELFSRFFQPHQCSRSSTLMIGRSEKEVRGQPCLLTYFLLDPTHQPTLLHPTHQPPTLLTTLQVGITMSATDTGIAHKASELLHDLPTTRLTDLLTN